MYSLAALDRLHTAKADLARQIQVKKSQLQLASSQGRRAEVDRLNVDLTLLLAAWNKARMHLERTPSPTPNTAVEETEETLF